MKCRWICMAAVLALSGCAHTEAFNQDNPDVGPFSAGPDVRLTLNADQDYWPVWTDDGRGILYAFVNSDAAGTPATRHRCMGILPAAGGSRVWQWCDDRATEADSATSFASYALGTDGRLLYVEAVAPAVPAALPRQVTLWLADTAAPLRRTALLSLPVNIGTTVSWLSDITWTGPNSFLALGQTLGSFPHCSVCFAADTLLADSTVGGGVATASGTVVVGTIAGNVATLQAVNGTAGATGYSLAENGASIIFTHRDDTRIYKVPSTGGTAVVVGTAAPAGLQLQLLGVSCKSTTCLVAVDAVTLSNGSTGRPIYPGVNTGPKDLVSVTLGTGTVQTLRSFSTSPATPIIASPRISPTSADVVVQIGGVFGHLQTNTGGGSSDLHLYQALIP